MTTTYKTTEIRHLMRVAALSVLFLVPSSSEAQETERQLPVRSVYTNSFRDNWEYSFGVEYLSFYSQYEKNLDLSKSPFKSYRANFGAAATIGKWFTPEIGLRTKASGYWGKAVISDDAEKNAIRFYAIQEYIFFLSFLPVLLCIFLLARIQLSCLYQAQKNYQLNFHR